MVLTKRSIAIGSLLLVLSSGIVSGIFNNPTATLNPLNPDFYAKGDYAPYYPDKTHMNYEKPNLFVGGIFQNSPNSEFTDQKWKTFADNNGAIFIPTYYSNIGKELLAVNDAAKSKPNDENGLTRDELNWDKPYGTIIGYSGGTATVITAMADQGLKADTLILISPMMGGSLMPGETFDWKGEFEQKIQTILSKNPGIKIVVIQSPDDTLILGDGIESIDATGYQYRFPVDNIPADSWMNKIEVHNVKGTGHVEIFDTYAMNNIKDGAYLDPDGQSTSTTNPVKQSNSQTKKVEPAALSAFGLGSPGLSPDSGISWISNPDKEGIDKAQGSSYIDKAQDVWFIDALSYDFGNDISIYQKPGAPYRFASGEINSYGYNWIYLPHEKTGIWFSQGYFDWVNGYLESIGSSGPGAGYGLLVSEDSEF